MDALLSVREAAEFLGVSQATVYHWARSGILQGYQQAVRRFPAEQVHKLQRAIAAGHVPRLNARANKRHADGYRIPFSSRPEDGNDANQIIRLRRLIRERQLNPACILYVRALRLLAEAGEWEPATPFSPALPPASRWRRQSVARIMRGWRRDLGVSVLSAADYRRPFELPVEPVSGSDQLGFLYQALRRTGSRVQAGSFYTPPEVVRSMTAGLTPHDGFTLLDPGCGSGQFLLGAAEAGWKFDQLFGIDLDPLALRLAALNLLLAFPAVDALPNLKCADALLTDSFGRRRFDVVIGNPPWGRLADGELRRHLNRRYLRKRNFSESFSYFLLRARALAVPGGTIRFLLPEAILNIRRHAEIRSELLNECTWRGIAECGRKFSGVFTGAITLDLLNIPPSPNHRIEIRPEAGPEFQLLQTSLKPESGLVIQSGPLENSIWEKVNRYPHRTLKDSGAEWALGIVTGNNRKWLLPVGSRGGEPIVRGVEVQPYRLAPAQYEIFFDPKKFQQCAPERLYRVPEKLVYRFISRRLVFALDRKGVLTLNSANNLIVPPAFYPMKLIAVLFNSGLYQLLFRSRFNTHKVLRSDLEQLPLPDFPAPVRAELSGLADRLLAGDASAISRVDVVLASVLGLTEAEKVLVTEL